MLPSRPEVLVSLLQLPLPHRVPNWALFTLTLGLALSSSGCGDSSADEEPADSENQDTSGPPGDTAPPVDTGTPPPVTPPPGLLYVSGARGDDAQDGTVDQRPTLAGNHVDGGTGATSATGVSVLDCFDAVSVEGNTIFGGASELSFGVRLEDVDRDCRIEFNEIDGGRSTQTFGVHSEGADTDPIISGNTISGGGDFMLGDQLRELENTGIYVGSGSNASVSNNVVVGGRSFGWTVTHGIFVRTADPTIQGNTIDAGQESAGIYLDNADATIRNNRVTHRQRFASIYLANFSNPTISGDFLWGITCIQEAAQSADPISIGGVTINCGTAYVDLDIPWSFPGGQTNGSFVDNVGEGPFGPTTPIATDVMLTSDPFPG